MKRLLSILSFILITFAISCKNEQGKTPGSSKTLSVEDYDKMLSSNPDVQLIDVRSTTEYNGGHLKNARNIDINSRDFDEQVNSLKKKKPVMVYCLSGGRSSEAAGKLKDMGFDVYNLEGGLVKWKAAGKPLEAGSSALAGLSLEDFTKLVSKSNYVLVDFNAQWCGPCKKLSPILDEFADKKRDKLTLLKIDADANPDLLTEKKIEGIPYLELYKDGVMIWKHEGFIEESDLVKETQL